MARAAKQKKEISMEEALIKYELYITPVTTYVLDGFYTED